MNIRLKINVDFKINLRYAIIILIAAAIVFIGLQVVVSNVDPNSVPAILQPVWDIIVYIFNAPAVIIAFTFLRNIMGYIENKFQEAGQQLQYDAKQLAETFSRFSVYIYGLTAAIQAALIGTPYAQYSLEIAGAIGLVFDMFIRALKELAQAAKAPTPTPAVAVATSS